MPAPLAADLSGSHDSCVQRSPVAILPSTLAATACGFGVASVVAVLLAADALPRSLSPLRRFWFSQMCTKWGCCASVGLGNLDGPWPSKSSKSGPGQCWHGQNGPFARISPLDYALELGHRRVFSGCRESDLSIHASRVGTFGIRSIPNTAKL